MLSTGTPPTCHACGGTYLPKTMWSMDGKAFCSRACFNPFRKKRATIEAAKREAEAAEAKKFRQHNSMGGGGPSAC